MIETVLAKGRFFILINFIWAPFRAGGTRFFVTLRSTKRAQTNAFIPGANLKLLNFQIITFFKLTQTFLCRYRVNLIDKSSKTILEFALRSMW